MKKYLIVLLVVLLLFVVMLSVAIYQNNKSAEPVSRYELQQSFERASGWLSDNQNILEKNHNPILWWMLKQAADNTGDEFIMAFYQNYKRKHIDSKPPDIWTPFFRENFRPEVPDIIQLTNYSDYQIFFVYSLSCDNYLEEEPIIRSQMSPDFCTMHYVHPRCITHQLMGLRLMQRYSCGHEQTVKETIASLKNMLVDELTWDFRVGEAYIQRILMLADIGSYDRVKPVWLHRFISAQNPDGGWDDLHPLLPLPGGYKLGFASMLPSIQRPTSNFHATAQAVWLLSILLQDQQ